jgi:two-component system, NarL family, nitrate/nitrite response regulator NarL
MRRPTILIADDHPLMLDGIAGLLDVTEFDTVARCTTGTEARNVIMKTVPDAAVLDIHMPGLSGIDLLREARSKGWSTKMVLLTATLDPQPLLDAVDLKVDGLILKYAASSMLLRCLRSALAGDQWIDKEALTLVTGALAAKRAAPSIPNLTPRERDVAQLVATERRNKEIATELGTTEGTVKMYLHTIYDKLAIGSRTELVIFARNNGLA